MLGFSLKLELNIIVDFLQPHSANWNGVELAINDEKIGEYAEITSIRRTSDARDDMKKRDDEKEKKKLVIF